MLLFTFYLNPIMLIIIFESIQTNDTLYTFNKLYNVIILIEIIGGF